MRRKPAPVDRRQLLTLIVGDDGELRHLVIRRRAEHDGRLDQARDLRRSPATFPVDQLQLAADLPDGQRLDEAVEFERVGKLLQLDRIELDPRLKWIRLDLGQRRQREERGCRSSRER